MAEARTAGVLGIELHDSVITRLDVEGTAVVVEMDAYVHHSGGVPGVDAGTVWIHRAEIRLISGIIGPRQPTLPADISDGVLSLDERRLENVIPVPLRFAGDARLDLVLKSAETVSIEAREVSTVLLDEGKYLEAFSPVIPRSGFGPRTDVRYMTRVELLKSAWQFLFWGLSMSAVLLVVGYLGFRAGRTPGALPLGLTFLCTVLAAMGFGGSLYLVVRGLARSRSYDPLSVWRADQERWAEREGVEMKKGRPRSR